jgi:hypothetical protein
MECCPNGNKGTGGGGAEGFAAAFHQMTLEQTELEVVSLTWHQRAHSACCAVAMARPPAGDTTCPPHQQRVEVLCPRVWALQPRSS